MDIWSQEEAESWFKKIEESNGENESEIIDWKETLNLNDTGFNKDNNTNNTTQRAMSGFANTLGGYLVLGFSKIGELKGIKITDVENKIFNSFHNRKNTNLNKIKFKVNNYKYNGNNIIVIFIDKSKEPIQCDNGAYYYREQTQFLVMSYIMLENKFRKYLDEEKYLYLTLNELKQFKLYVSSKSVYLKNECETLGYKIDHYVKLLTISGEKLYFLYTENDLFSSYFPLMHIVNVWVANQSDYPINQNMCQTLIENIEGFYNQLDGVYKSNK